MPRVLIVDDSTLARKLLRRVLENLNCEVVAEAESGERAIILYRKHLPDIVTMDIVMKGTDGLEASKIIKKINPDAKIIVVSSHAQNDLKTELVNNDLNYLILKPVDENKMADAINKIMAGHESNIILDDTAEKKLRKEFRSYLSTIGKGTHSKEKEQHPHDEFMHGSKVSVSHYFSQQPLTATVIERAPDELTLRFEKEITGLNFLAGDPVTMCFSSKDDYKIYEACIFETFPKDKKAKVKLLKCSLINDKKLDENFPMSLSIDFKQEYQNKKKSAVIKNLGPYNIQIVSKAELNEGEKISFDVFLEERVISLNAEVAAKTQGYNNYEYELQTTFIDLNSKKFLKFFIQKLRDKYEKYIQSLTNL